MLVFSSCWQWPTQVNLLFLSFSVFFFISEAFFPANWEERLRNDLGYFVSSGTLNLAPSIRGQTHETTKS